MIAYAFKKAALAGSLWSRIIAWRTKGPYSHVELWIYGPQTHAACFSSREGSGCDFVVLNLTDPMWDIVPIKGLTAAQENSIYMFCAESDHRGYDYLGLLGLDTGHGEHVEKDRFCSEVCFEALQVVAGFWTDLKRWLVSPNKLAELIKAHNDTTP